LKAWHARFSLKQPHSDPILHQIAFCCEKSSEYLHYQFSDLHRPGTALRTKIRGSCIMVRAMLPNPTAKYVPLPGTIQPRHRATILLGSNISRPTTLEAAPAGKPDPLYKYVSGTCKSPILSGHFTDLTIMKS
jgi:hypothetical protein